MPADQTREEHLAWCKARALEELNNSSPTAITNAFASMSSDLSKHEGTEDSVQICVLLGMAHMDSKESMRRFIEGFN